MLSGMYSAEQTLRDSDFIPRLQEEKTTNRKVVHCWMNSFTKNSDQSVIIVSDILDDSPYLMTETHLCMSVKSRKKANDQHFFRWLKML